MDGCGTVSPFGYEGSMAEVVLDDVVLDFPVYGASYTRSLRKELVRVATGGLIKRNPKDLFEIRALNQLNLTIEHGTKLGLIGHNGAGKSTLLRIITGIFTPTSGRVQVEGVVTPLLDVMFGMYEDLTGFENILLRGTLHGLSPKEIKEKEADIVKSSGLGDYVHMPIRTYSSGMKVRLAFSVNTCIHPQILIMDELVGAGDASFQEEAKVKLSGLISASDIFIIASHNTEWIRNNCNQVLWLDTGKVAFYGDVEEGISRYLDSI